MNKKPDSCVSGSLYERNTGTCISELSDSETDRPLRTSGVSDLFFLRVPTTLAKLLLAADIDSITLNILNWRIKMLVRHGRYLRHIMYHFLDHFLPVPSGEQWLDPYLPYGHPFIAASRYYADGNTDVKYRCFRMLDWLVSTYPLGLN